MWVIVPRFFKRLIHKGLKGLIMKHLLKIFASILLPSMIQAQEDEKTLTGNAHVKVQDWTYASVWQFWL